MTPVEIETEGARILLVDDAAAEVGVLLPALEKQGYEVRSVGAGAAALELAPRFAPDLILLEAALPGMDGFEVCRRLRQDEETRSIPVVFLVDPGDSPDAIEGLGAAAADCVVRPLRMGAVLGRVRLELERVRLLRQVAEKNRQLEAQAAELEAKNLALEAEMERYERLRSERDALRDRVSRVAELEAEQHGDTGFIGRSRAIEVVLEEVQLLRRAYGVSVLITGESGTGKELIARAIHFGGLRSEGPFVSVNCAAIPRDLVESSFFGHRRGAFTGAHEARRGYFEQAHRGTLFLDEIGDLPLELQGKLLRAVETGRVTPVGETEERAVDVRILSATNRDLPAMIAGGHFREDLYFRLAGFTVALPPLRDRPEDIPLLVEHFLQRLSSEMSLEPPGIDPEALGRLTAHRFPGNVRELHNLVEFALIKSQGQEIRPEHLRIVHLGGREAGDGRAAPPPARPAEREALPPAEERILAHVRSCGSISNRECRQLLDVDLERASYLLKKLHRGGLLEKRGERRWTRYGLPG